MHKPIIVSLALDPQVDDDTLEARVVRAEAAAREAIDRCWRLEAELMAVDAALDRERVPQFMDGNALVRRPRYGRVRYLGDRARRAEAALKELARS